MRATLKVFSGGISLSPAFVVMFVMQYYHMSWEDALHMVQNQRYCISPNGGFLTQIKVSIVYNQTHGRFGLQLNCRNTNPSIKQMRLLQRTLLVKARFPGEKEMTKMRWMGMSAWTDFFYENWFLNISLLVFKSKKFLLFFSLRIFLNFFSKIVDKFLMSKSNNQSNSIQLKLDWVGLGWQNIKSKLNPI